MPKKTTQKSIPTPTQTAPSPSFSANKKAKAKVDPAILELRKKHREEIQAYKKTRGSNEVLQRIINKEIPRLTREDKQHLFNYMAKTPKDRMPEMESEPTLTEPETTESVNPWPTEE
jgi:hypothetical protein